MFLRAARKGTSIVVITLIFLASSFYLYSSTDYTSTSSPTRLPPIDSPWTRRIPKHPIETFRQLPTGTPLEFPAVQVKGIAEDAEARANRNTRLTAVKEAFLHSWNGYREYAWLADELKPVTGGQKDAFGNWSATLVDSLDTLWIMGLHQEFDEAVQAVAAIDFETSTSKTIIVFETTIRYLGGLLSAYELSGQVILLQKAMELGYLLYAAFDTPTHMPIPYFDWQNALSGGPQNTENHVISADIGSLSLEFTKLSQLSGDMKFFDAIQRISDLFAAQQNLSSIPGLWPVFVDALDMNFATGDTFSFGALADSLYEYTSKMHILLGGLLPEYGQMYQKAVDAAKRHLFTRAMNPRNQNLLVSTVATFGNGSSSSDASSQHLACFVGGMVAVGSRLFERAEDLEIATMLTDGCFWAYETMGSGIMPEVMTVVPCPTNTEQCEWDEAAWKKAVMSHANNDGTRTMDEVVLEKGLQPGVAWIPDGRYALRPEAIESLFYMYRITGDVSWQDKAWEMFSAIAAATRTNHGFSAIGNVAAKKLTQVDSMESFWTAETLKYFYLIFSDLDLISLDEWVFNTEAHPLRRTVPERTWRSKHHNKWYR